MMTVGILKQIERAVHSLERIAVALERMAKSYPVED